MANEARWYDRFPVTGYREITPQEALRPYVAAIWIWTGSGEEGSHRVLPDGCIDIIFTEGSDRLFVVGTMTRYFDASQNGVRQRIGVRFRPGAAGPFLPVPARELTDKRVPLEDLWEDNEARGLLTQLEGARSIAARVKLLETKLVEKRSRPSFFDERWRRAAARLVESRGMLSPGALSFELGVSERQLRRGFDAAVGVSPKRLGRILRFQALLGIASQSRARDWSALALDAGFYDQPHLISDFRAMTGTSPTRYFRP